MRRAATKRRWASVLAVALLAAIAALAAAAPPAAASYRHHYGHYPYRPYCPYCGHRPVYYPPAVIAPAPVVVAPPPPVIVAPPPVIAAPMAPPVLAPPAVAGPGLPGPPPGSLPQAAAGYPAAPLAPGLEGTPGCLVVREYTTEIQVGGKTVEGYGYACLQADGSWKRGAPAPVP